MTTTRCLSGARLAGLRFSLPCHEEALRDARQAFGLAPVTASVPAPIPGGPRMWCELWHLSDGRLELAGLDQHAWSAMLGAWAGTWWGAWRGMLTGRPQAMVTSAREGASAAVEWSQIHSMTLGHYREMLLAIPSFAEGTSEGKPMLVVGMLTDSPIAQWADGAWGYGFGKRLARLEARSLLSWQVASSTGVPLLAVDVMTEAADPQQLTLLEQDFGSVLLGRRSDRQLVSSRLSRQANQVVGIRGQVHVSPALHPWLVAGTHSIEPMGDHDRWGGVHFLDVHARIGFPQRWSPSPMPRGSGSKLGKLG